MSGIYTEISGKKISRGMNVNGSATAIPARRFCGYADQTTDTEDAINLLSVTGLEKIKGVTAKSIAVGEVGDVYAEDDMVVPVESTAAAIAVGVRCQVEQSTGKILAVGAVAGTRYTTVGIAETPVGGSGGVVMLRLKRDTFTVPA